MTCTSCFITLLDNSDPSVRQDLVKMLSVFDQLQNPLGKYQAQLDQFNNRLNDFTDEINGHETNINAAGALITKIQQAQTDLGFPPGSCPQADFLITQLQTFQNLALTRLQGEMLQHTQFLRDAQAYLGGGVGFMNSLISSVPNLNC